MASTGQISPDSVEMGETGAIVKSKSTSKSKSTLSRAKPNKSKLVAQRAQEIHKHIKEVEESRKKQKSQRRKSFFSDAKSEEDVLAESLGHKHWRVCWLKFLQGHIVQYGLTFLLVLDIVIVLSEVFVEAEYPSCYRISRDAISCCPSAGARQLGGGSTNEPICMPPLAPKFDYGAGCDDHKFPAVHAMHSIAFIASATILCLFEVELLATLSALGTLFFKNPLYLLDMIVVTASLVLDFHLHLGKAAAGESGATILIVARCWRFVRVIHGVTSSSHERDMEQCKETVELARQLEEEAEDLTKEVEELERQLDELCVQLETTNPQ